MQDILQYTTLAARTLQGISPIFIQYALGIALAGFALFSLGEVMSYLLRYQDRRQAWIAQVFGVHEKDVIPLASAHLLGRETLHPGLKHKNPFHIPFGPAPGHKGDYIVRGPAGSAFVSVHNWRGLKARQCTSRKTPGYVRSVDTEKSQIFTGFRKRMRSHSPDEDIKSKAATLSALLVARFGCSARVSSICLHKNRPPLLNTRSPLRDIHGRPAAHVDLEQLHPGALPCGQGGRIDDETWMDLRTWILAQPSRMTPAHQNIIRILTMSCLLAVFSITESATLSEFELNLLQEKLSEAFHSQAASPVSLTAHPR